jgi:hypothetical protein
MTLGGVNARLARLFRGFEARRDVTRTRSRAQILDPAWGASSKKASDEASAGGTDYLGRASEPRRNPC